MSYRPSQEHFEAIVGCLTREEALIAFGILRPGANPSNDERSIGAIRQALIDKVVTPAFVERLNARHGADHDAAFYAEGLMTAFLVTTAVCGRALERVADPAHPQLVH